MKTKLKENYENACNAYLKAFCEKHGFDFEDARDFWVANSVGTVVCVADYFANMETIRIDIDRDAPVDEFVAWYDYDLTMHTVGARSMNYDQWLMGVVPRKSEAEIQWLEAEHAKIMKLEDRVAEAKLRLEEAIKAENY